MQESNTISGAKVIAKSPSRGIADYLALAKVRLASSVVFSSLAGYLIATPEFSILSLVLLLVGGFLVVGASNGFNQIIERSQDAIMDRTMDRPIPAGRMSVKQASFASGIMGVVGISLLYILNPLSAIFGFTALLLYVLVYTPLKGKTPWAVFVGAIPGAIPFMLGWTAATGDFDIVAGTLFAIQFLWQFPHFWALAWMLDDDYKKVGYELLPTREKDKGSAFQIFVYTLGMLVVSLLPLSSLTGSLSLSPLAAFIVAALGVYMLVKAIVLLKTLDLKDAKKLFFSSLAYLPLVQIVMIIDKLLS